MGDSCNGLATWFHLGVSTVHYTVKNTCDVIWGELAPTYLPQPKRDDWIRIEKGFNNRWNFPNCVGALDGKHIVLQSPAKSGSLYFNYKGTFSLVLMALVDHEYRFTLILEIMEVTQVELCSRIQAVDRHTLKDYWTYHHQNIFQISQKVDHCPIALLLMRHSLLE